MVHWLEKFDEHNYAQPHFPGWPVPCLVQCSTQRPGRGWTEFKKNQVNFIQKFWNLEPKIMKFLTDLDSST